ncbi:hypothetical protein M0D21_22480 [Aquimarina sp. D1M17]|uniref:hypothetical protein n=1 Tax=Aquimarina acroporae TaxID=2937283 RepID=UPI0020BFADEF|nr:hypothetical protein [Aquimarina acroporae]MCK8524362.1 hypothetical protein [Aquimarina acroporae]
MSKENKDLKLIEAYFELSLSDEELIAFEERIESDPEFARKLYIYEESLELVEKRHPSVLENPEINEWKKILDDQKGSQTKVVPIWKWIGGTAAAIAVIFFVWQNDKLNTPDMTIALQEAWNKEIGLDYRMMRAANKDSLQIIILQAFDSYQAENYEKTITISQSFNPESLYYEDALLLKGLSLYKKGDVSQSLEVLEFVSELPSRKKAKVALWYQGLIYLEIGDLKNAQKLLVLPGTKDQTIKLKE